MYFPARTDGIRTFRHALRAAYRTAISAAQILVIIITIIIILNPLYLLQREVLKIDENDWKGMMLSPCSQGPAGCRVAEQHWNAAPAPKFADTND